MQQDKQVPPVEGTIEEDTTVPATPGTLDPAAEAARETEGQVASAPEPVTAAPQAPAAEAPQAQQPAPAPVPQQAPAAQTPAPAAAGSPNMPQAQEGQIGDDQRIHFESTDDERTKNSVVGHEYRQLTEKEKAQVKRLKDIGQAFIDTVNAIKADDLATSPHKDNGREFALGIARAEEAVMWAVKGVTK